MILKLSTMHKKLRNTAMALIIAGAGLAGGFAVFNNTNQAQAAGECVRYSYSYGGVANCIIYIQQIINASGVTGAIQADGDFGPKTKAAVITFQKNRGLVADGIVGKNTWNKLCNVTQAAATTPKAKAGCALVVTPPTTPPVTPPATGWTKVAWGSATNGSYKAATNIYACKVPVTASTFQVRSKVAVTSSTGNPQILTGLTVRKNDAANTVTTSYNNGASVRFTGTPGAVFQMGTNPSATASSTDKIWVETSVISGASAAGAASTFNNFGSAISRPVLVSQLISC